MKDGRVFVKAADLIGYHHFMKESFLFVGKEQVWNPYSLDVGGVELEEVGGEALEGLLHVELDKPLILPPQVQQHTDCEILSNRCWSR